MSRTPISQTTTSTTHPPPPPPMQGGRGVAASQSKKAGPTTCGFRLPKRRPKNIQPLKLFKKLGLKLARATRMVSTRTCKVSSSSSAAAILLRSRSCADPITDDSHRAQAIEDCIEFLNSSSSLQRLNSVSSSYSA